MNRVLFVLPLLTCAALVLADEPTTKPATQPTTLPAHVSDASYGIGYNMGKQMSGSLVKLDVDRLIQGLHDSVDGKQSAVAEEVLEAAMMKLQQEAMAAQMKLQKEQAEKNGPVAGDAFRLENAKKPNVKTTASGLQIETIKEGTGESPKASDTVKVHYTGTLVDGTKFDSSVDRGKPAEFPVGEVIKGWTEALQLMKVGGKVHLVIPPTLGYQERGKGPIPPNATLVFDVELLEIVKAAP